MMTHVSKVPVLKKKKERKVSLNLSNVRLQYTATTAYFTYKSVRKYSLFSNSLAGTLSEATVSFTACSA